ncbi:MAG TPA: hypothetical protein ENK38_02075 [Gammaproteobacteria bacterium]|nr:hypothetical protein [Gammaproteobacteria bacterium]
MIKPTVGRVVHYIPKGDRNDDITHASDLNSFDDDQPLAAIITHVWSESMVNLVVFDADGVSNPRTSVSLVQPGQDINFTGPYCQWMPYQVGQAQKAEALQEQLDGNQSTLTVNIAVPEGEGRMHGTEAEVSGD